MKSSVKRESIRTMSPRLAPAFGLETMFLRGTVGPIIGEFDPELSLSLKLKSFASVLIFCCSCLSISRRCTSSTSRWRDAASCMRRRSSSEESGEEDKSGDAPSENSRRRAFSRSNSATRLPKCVRIGLIMK